MKFTFFNKNEPLWFAAMRTLVPPNHTARACSSTSALIALFCHTFTQEESFTWVGKYFCKCYLQLTMMVEKKVIANQWIRRYRKVWYNTQTGSKARAKFNLVISAFYRTPELHAEAYKVCHCHESKDSIKAQRRGLWDLQNFDQRSIKE
jgi:hypothetical protein